MNLLEFFGALENVRVDLDRKHTVTRGTDTLYPVYIILYAQNSLVSKTIRTATKTPYSHASISFDSSMQHIFSFGKLKIREDENSRRVHNGAIRESFISKIGMREFPKEAQYEIYTIFIPKDNLEKMRKRIHEIFDNPERYKFSIIGLVRYYLGLVSESTSKMFCSQFVATILATGNVNLERSPSLYSPYELKDIQNVIFVERDVLKNFSRKRFDKQMDFICQDYNEKINTDAE